MPRTPRPETPDQAIGDRTGAGRIHPVVLTDAMLAVPPAASPSIRPLKEALEEPERAILLQALRFYGWSRNDTADALEISRSTLYHKMKKYHLLINGEQ